VPDGPDGPVRRDGSSRPDAPARPAGSPPPAPSPRPDASARPDAPPDRRSPGGREVLVVAALVLGAVFAVELLSALVPPLRELFRGFPTTIVILVVGTVGLLLAIALRRPRP